MAAEPFHELISSIRTRLQSELDAQMPALAAAYAEAVTNARTTAEGDAERKWAAILDEQQAQARKDLEATTAAVRSESPDHRRLLEAFRRFDSAVTVSDLLTAIASAAAAQSARAALYIGPELDPWNGAGPPGDVAVLREAIVSGRTIRKDTGRIVAPLLLDGDAVAVLDADSAGTSERWAETIELIAAYGAAHLAALTAVRTAQAQRWIQAPSAGSTARPSEQKVSGPAGEDAVESAKRYARLLVSEIKLYNEAAVHEGRAQRDLARRLAAEIERARHLYEERVPSTVADRGTYFRQELIQTLAGGDLSLLG